MVKSIRKIVFPVLLTVSLLTNSIIPMAGAEINRASDILSVSSVIDFNKSEKPILPDGGAYAKDRLLVKLKKDDGMASAMSVLSPSVTGMSRLFGITESPKVQSHSTSESLGNISAAEWYLVSLKEGTQLQRAMDEIYNHPSVLSVEPDYEVTIDDPVSIEEQDPFEKEQYFLNFIDAYGAYERLEDQVPGEGIVVAVLDTGIDESHPEFENSIQPGGKLITTVINAETYEQEIVLDDDYTDRFGHGTHVAGIIAAEKNQKGVTGVAYGAKILPVKVMDDSGTGYDSTILAGIEYAVSSGADIINMSVGGLFATSSWTDACKFARDSGVFMVASAGNSGLPTASMGSSFYHDQAVPANEADVMAVMALQEYPTPRGDCMANYSNWDSDPYKGAEYQIAAPGSDILSTYIGGRYSKMSGTSMAAPIVSGAAAVLAGQGLDCEEIWSRLLATADEVQGKTGDNREALDVRSVNLNSALTEKSIDPVVKASIYPQIRREVIVDTEQGYGIDAISGTLSAIVTTSDVCASDIIIELNAYDDDISGIEISGTGVKTVSVPDKVMKGRAENAVLSIEGIPEDKFSTTLYVKYVNSRGVIENGLQIPVSLPVIKASLPKDIVWNASGFYEFAPSVSQVKISDPNTLWVLPADLRLESGETLSMDKDTTLYLGKDASVKVAGGRFEVNGTLQEPSTIFAEELVNIKKDSGYLSIKGGVIYSPNIKGANIIENSQISQIQTNYIWDDMDRYKLNADHIKNSGLLDLYGASITVKEFEGNLVDNCVGASLTSENIHNNTFKENLDIFPLNSLSDSNQCMIIITKDYDNDSGFYDNCVIGPLKVYSDYKPAFDIPAKLAVIDNVYYKKTGAKVYESFPTLTDVDDKVYCSIDSENVSANAEKMSELLGNCPPFILTQRLDYGKFLSDELRCIYKIELIFSGAMDINSEVYANARLYNFLYNESRLKSGEISWSDDGKACTITLYDCIDTTTGIDFYEFAGFYPKGKPNMTLGYQSSFDVPVGVEWIFSLNEMEIEDTLDGAKINWTAGQGGETFFVINRVEADGTKTQIFAEDASLISQSIMTDEYTYTDTAIENGRQYTYTVDGYISQDGQMVLVSTGIADFIRADGIASIAFGSINMNLKGRLGRDVSIVAEKGFEADSLQFDIAHTKGIKISDIENKINTPGYIPMGVSRIDDGLIRVTIGAGEISGKITTGTPIIEFTVSAGEDVPVGSISVQSVQAVLNGEILQVTNSAVCQLNVTERPKANIISQSLDEMGNTITLLEMSDGTRASMIKAAEGGTLTADIDAAGKSIMALPLEGSSNIAAFRESGSACCKSLYENGVLYVEVDGDTQLDIRDNTHIFADVPLDYWAYDAISFVSSRELFKGVTPTHMDPYLYMSRGMLVTVLHRLEGLPLSETPAAFYDIPEGIWFEDAVSWAASESIVLGTGECFEPNEAITREQLAVMIYRYAEKLGVTSWERKNLETFSDSSDVSDWAREALEWTVGVGLVKGRVGNVLDPGGDASRSDVAMIISRFVSEVLI